MGDAARWSGFPSRSRQVVFSRSRQPASYRLGCYALCPRVIGGAVGTLGQAVKRGPLSWATYWTIGLEPLRPLPGMDFLAIRVGAILAIASVVLRALFHLVAYPIFFVGLVVSIPMTIHMLAASSRGLSFGDNIRQSGRGEGARLAAPWDAFVRTSYLGLAVPLLSGCVFLALLLLGAGWVCLSIGLYRPPSRLPQADLEMPPSRLGRGRQTPVHRTCKGSLRPQLNPGTTLIGWALGAPDGPSREGQPGRTSWWWRRRGHGPVRHALPAAFTEPGYGCGATACRRPACPVPLKRRQTPRAVRIPTVLPPGHTTTPPLDGEDSAGTSLLTDRGSGIERHTSVIGYRGWIARPPADLHGTCQAGGIRDGVSDCRCP